MKKDESNKERRVEVSYERGENKQDLLAFIENIITNFLVVLLAVDFFGSHHVEKNKNARRGLELGSGEKRGVEEGGKSERVGSSRVGGEERVEGESGKRVAERRSGEHRRERSSGGVAGLVPANR